MGVGRTEESNTNTGDEEEAIVVCKTKGEDDGAEGAPGRGGRKGRRRRRWWRHQEKKGGCGGEKVGEPASASIHVFSVVARYDPDVRS